MPLSSACLIAGATDRGPGPGAAGTSSNFGLRLCGSIVVSLAMISGVQPAQAADCKQANAVYGDRDGAYELRFQPLGSTAAAASNQFTLKAKASPAEMQGFVMPSEDPVRTNAIVMFNCPEGDTTGEQLDACTIWQGPIYAMDTTGAVANLSAEGDRAAERLLLPGLGPSIRESSLWQNGKVTVAPWDVLAYGGCAK